MAVNRTENGLLLNIILQPKAGKDQIVGLYGDELKITITAPPIDVKANAHLLKFLINQFTVAKTPI